MMDKEKLRKADFLIGIVLFFFGLWICFMGFGMPMKASYGGVVNVWYVSPALSPLVIGCALMLLSLVLVVNAVKHTGVGWITQKLSKLSSIFQAKPLSVKGRRFIGIITVLLAFVFLNIPRVDFFLSCLLFLLVFITMFHFDSDELLGRFLWFYWAGTIFFVLYFAFGLAGVMDGLYYFMTDVFVLLFIIVYAVFAGLLTRGNEKLKKRFRTSLIIALVVPVILCPVFKYFLLVPLPKEGLVIEGVMNAIRYSLF